MFECVNLSFLKIFARPFVGAMDGHIDAVSCMAKNPNHLKGVFSGSMDGGMILFTSFVFISSCIASSFLILKTFRPNGKKNPAAF